jgi:phospholipid/cholesterol/gamma-HCH transport system ATP-binding protein
MSTAIQTAAIQTSDLHKAYGEQVVLKNVTLSVTKGETLAVLGRSGTGKSVLLRLLIGLEQPDSGSIHLQDIEITALRNGDLSEIRKKVGYLFQQGALYDSLTLAENVAFPLERHTKLNLSEIKSKVQELLSSVGLNDHAGKLPSEISGGMQKRVALARALALDPDILLLDEPTAGLDPITSSEIDGLILEEKKKRGITSVVVTHDIPGVRIFADRVALLNEGAIVAQGTMAELEKSQDKFVIDFLKGGSHV